MSYNKTMKRYRLTIIALILSLTVFSCAPVLRKDIMDAALRDVPLSDLKQNPEKYKGRLFVLGGIIVNTKVTGEGSLIEALYVPVDSRGYLKEIGISYGRFYALLAKESGLLDPMIFRREREITFAGEFLGIRQGKIDEMDYGYPFFQIKELYLWEERIICYVPSPYYDPYLFWWDYPYWWRGHPYGWRYHGLGPPPPYWW